MTRSNTWQEVSFWLNRSARALNALRAGSGAWDDATRARLIAEWEQIRARAEAAERALQLQGEARHA